MALRLSGKAETAGARNASGVTTLKLLSRFRPTSISLRKRTQMLTTDAIENAIEMYEGGANESTVVETTGISLEEAKAVADALYLGGTERLFREVALAGVLEAAAHAL